MLIAPLGAQAACNLAFLQGSAGSGRTITGQQDGQTPMLGPGRPVELELSGAQVDSYRLTVPAHQFAKIVVGQRGVDVTAQLLDSAGTLVADYRVAGRSCGRLNGHA